ncbi:MAG: ATP-binding protein [Phycisphaeraceae bacterium]
MELSPPILYEAGLVSALQWLGRWMQEKCNMTIHLAIEQDVDLENEDLRVLTFQSVRELLFNTMKYAGVKEAHVQLRQPDEAHLQIIVADRGKGFDVEQAHKEQHEGGGFGLFSIRQRLEVMGGEMDIWSQPGKGTRTTLLVPFRRRLPGSHTTSKGTRIADE